MNTKVTNITGSGIRQVLVNRETGKLVDSDIVIKDDTAVSYQNGDGIIHTVKTYKGDDDEILAFLNGDANILVTESSRRKSEMLSEIGGMLNEDCFGYMSPRTVRLHDRLHDLKNGLLDYATTRYDADDLMAMGCFESELQPFWEENLAVDAPLDEAVEEKTQMFYVHSQYAIIYQNKDGVWDALPIRNSVVNGKDIVPADSVGDVYLTNTERPVHARVFRDVRIVRIKGNNDE